MSDRPGPGRPAKSKSRRKSTVYSFRVNAFEKQILDEFGETVDWRKFILTFARVARTIKNGAQNFSGEPLTLNQIDWDRLFRECVIEGVDPEGGVMDYVRQPELAEVDGEP